MLVSLNWLNIWHLSLIFFFHPMHFPERNLLFLPLIKMILSFCYSLEVLWHGHCSVQSLVPTTTADYPPSVAIGYWLPLPAWSPHAWIFGRDGSYYALSISAHIYWLTNRMVAALPKLILQNQLIARDLLTVVIITRFLKLQVYATAWSSPLSMFCTLAR